MKEDVKQIIKIFHSSCTKFLDFTAFSTLSFHFQFHMVLEC